MLTSRRREFKIQWLLVVFILTSILGWFGNTFTPSSTAIIIIFFLFILAIFTTLGYFLLNNVRRGILCGIGAVIFLLLRYLHLREIIYPLLLIAALISIEYYLSKPERHN